MTERSQFRLLAERRFGPFFGVQFLGAMNDNVFKQALVILLAYQTASFTTLASDTLQNLAQALFVLPFFLFSATAGQIADKFEKSRLITVTVAIELACMGLGAVGLLTQNLSLLLAALFLGGVQSTLFGPVKYAILPQQLQPGEIVGGNGLVEMGTSIAILLGMIYGGWMVTQPGWGVAGVAVSAMAFSAAGIALSRLIPEASAAEPGLRINWNPVSETWRNLAFARRNRTVFLSILGISWFWFYGSMFVTQFPNLSKNILQADEHVVTLLLVVFSIGIGVGSLLCERLSGHKVEIGLVPFGSIGLTLFGIDLWHATAAHLPHGPVALGAFARDPGHWRLLADLALIGLFGGFYIVPLYALVQTRSEPSHRSRIIAGNNILNAIFMVAAAALAIGLFQLGLTIPQLILATALLNAVVAVYIYTLVPEFLMRFIVWILIHSVYRLKKAGLENIPEEGAAVIVCNHVSFVDALVIAAACRRPIRFVMDHQIFRLPILSFVFRTGKAIPIASAKQDPAMMQHAFEEVSQALRAGDLVAIFPEGRLTETGELGPFRAGIARILARDPVPVVPMALQGLWGSFFSRKDGAAMSKPWRLRPFARIGLAVGEPVAAAAARPDALQTRVLALRAHWR
ncbi:MAG: MFS transporter [Betaproteobacteria bacterium]|nr:MAG: MFS transporter [Betaproteobacteria bacterium]